MERVVAWLKKHNPVDMNKIEQEILEAFLDPFTESSVVVFDKYCRMLGFVCPIHSGACGPRNSICALKEAAIKANAKPKGTSATRKTDGRSSEKSSIPGSNATESEKTKVRKARNKK